MKNRAISQFFYDISVFFSSSASCTVYQWKGNDGEIVFSNQPPPTDETNHSTVAISNINITPSSISHDPDEAIEHIPCIRTKQFKIN